MAAPGKVLSFVSFCIFFSIFILFSVGMRKDIFSTKTSYHWVIDPDKNVHENEQMHTEFDGKSCVAVRVETMLRHGARQPGYKDIRKMTELHQKLKLTVTNKNFPFLNDWENHFPEHEEKNLVDIGEEEQFGIGLRFGKRLNKLFGNDISRVRFISSSKDRAKESAHALYEGLTEAVLHEAQDGLLPEIRDDLLRFHTSCGKFIDTVENNRTYLKEYIKFKMGSFIQQVSEGVAERLGMEHARLDAGIVSCNLQMFKCNSSARSRHLQQQKT